MGEAVPETGRQQIHSLLAEQHHLISRTDAAAVGVHPSVLHRMARGGALEVLAPGWYGTAGVPLTWDRRMRLALGRGGPLAAASHRAAARLLGVPTYEAAPPEITIPSKRHLVQDGVVVHQSRDLRYIPPIEIGGIRCTPPRRVAVDIGAVLGETAYATVLRALRRDHGVTWKQLAAILDLHSKRGRDGCGPLRRQIERYADIVGIPDSTLEQLFLDDLLDADFPAPVCQHEVPGPAGITYRLDFAYPHVLVAIEVDGPHHRRPEVAARDRRRDAHLASLGWLVLRFDEEAVTYHPSTALDEIRRALERRGGWPGPR